MINLIINDKKISTKENQTILQIAKENNIKIKTLCFLEDCLNVNKCGVCLVEIEGQEDLSHSCSTIAKDNMVIHTNSEKVNEKIKENISKILDSHNFTCGKCKRRETCELLPLVVETKARASKPFIVKDHASYIDDRSKSIVLDKSRCIKCGRCVATCREKVGTNSIIFHDVNGDIVVGPQNFDCFDDTNCILCGQCVNVCPVDALYEKSHIDRVKTALEDPEIHVIVAMAPSVRTSLGELFKMDYGIDVTNKIYTALRKIGFDKIFDLNFGADLTIMEEATELVNKIKNNDTKFPMFTSCCPAWVRLAENHFPELLDNLSSAKSPQQIFGAASKSYYPELENLDPKKVFTVTIMPCTAKKYEADRPEMVNNGIRNIDAVITTREFGMMLKELKIDFSSLEDGEMDEAMGLYTGAGAIFGVTGGVMEAALRSAKDMIEEKDLDKIEYTDVRGFEGIKEATVEINNQKYNVAVVNGASNFFKMKNEGLLEKKQYHFIEVMACSGGCINGGGQPRVTPEMREKIDFRKLRGNVLYNQDKNLKYRKSHQNPALVRMYEKYMGKPGEGIAHELLHQKYCKKLK